MPLLSQNQKNKALLQLRSGLSTSKIAALVGISLSYVVHLRKVMWGGRVGERFERQRGRHPKFFVDSPREETLCHSRY